MVDFTPQLLCNYWEAGGKFRRKFGGSRSRSLGWGGTPSTPRAAMPAAMRGSPLDIQIHHTNKYTHLLQTHTVNAQIQYTNWTYCTNLMHKCSTIITRSESRGRGGTPSTPHAAPPAVRERFCYTHFKNK